MTVTKRPTRRAAISPASQNNEALRYRRSLDFHIGGVGRNDHRQGFGDFIADAVIVLIAGTCAVDLANSSAKGPAPDGDPESLRRWKSQWTELNG